MCVGRKMKQKIVFIVIILIALFNFGIEHVNAGTVLRGGVSKVEEVPEDFYGTWVVAAGEISNTAPERYASSSVDVWTLCRYGDIIVLTNPVSGASAAITVDDVEGNTVKFSRTSESKSDGEVGHETPTLTISGDTFDGTDKMVIRTYRGNQILREDTMVYRIKGKKVSSNDLFK